jgi:large subunit ribosomal protein L2
MGKKLRQQRRGRGTMVYTKLPNTFDISVSYAGKPVGTTGEVVGIINHTGHTAPLMEILYDNFSTGYLLAPEGIRIGDKITICEKPAWSLGNVVKIGDVPEGIPVFNIESTPGDGGKFARAAGSSAYISAHTASSTTVVMPSKAMVSLSNDCRAQLGILAGGGMSEAPLMKAGKNSYIMRTLNRTWPVIRGVKSNPVDHPFGGKQHHKGQGSMTGRNAPPGRKVGHIAARRVGRKKR